MLEENGDVRRRALVQGAEAGIIARQRCSGAPGHGAHPSLSGPCYFQPLTWYLHITRSCSSCNECVLVRSQVLFNDTIYRNIAYGR